LKILYFVAGVATEAQKELAKKAGAVIRNRNAYHDGDFIEPCDAAMGDMPAAYRLMPIDEHNCEAGTLAKSEVPCAAQALEISTIEPEESAPIDPPKRRGRPRKHPVDPPVE
jgi:hypothetical protein